MVKEWIELEEMGHGFFVPVVAAYIAWKQRDEILAQPVKPAWGALVLVAWGFVQMLLGLVGSDYFVARTSFLISLVGVIWTVWGTAVLRSLLFPLFLLLFMIRIPLFIYSQITFPLQILASRVAEVSLSLLGIPVLRDGNILELPNRQLSVVEACSGIRSLMSLSFLSLVYSYFFDPKVWMRWFLLVLTVPIAILANASRVTLTGILSHYKPELAEGAYHSFEGWIIFLAALVMLVALHQITNWIWTFRRG
jgi:exosortase